MSGIDLIIERYNLYDLFEDDEAKRVLFDFILNKDGSCNINNINYVIRYCITHNSEFALYNILDSIVCGAELQYELLYHTLIFAIEKDIKTYRDIVKRYDTIDPYLMENLKNTIVLHFLKRADNEYSVNKSISLIDELKMKSINQTLLDVIILKYLDNYITPIKMSAFILPKLENIKLTDTVKLLIASNKFPLILRKIVDSEKIVKSIDTKSWKLYCKIFNRTSHKLLLKLLNEQGITKINGKDITKLSHTSLCSSINLYLHKRT